MEHFAPRCHKLGKKNCKRCQTAKGRYVDPDPTQGSIVANNPMDLLCIDFMKVDPSKDGKENVLVMTDAFSKFSVAVVMPNQQAKTVGKALVDKWFYAYGIPTRIHSDQGKSFDNKIIEQLCKIYSVKQSTTSPYNPHSNSPCERLNHMLWNLLQMLPKDQKPNWPAHLSALVFVYNAMPHSTTGYQPYQLMFGCKTQHLVTTGWGCPSIIVASPYQKTHGFNISMNWYGLQIWGH